MEIEQLGEGDHAVEEAVGEDYVVVDDEEPVLVGGAFEQRVEVLELALLEVVEGSDPVLDTVAVAGEVRWLAGWPIYRRHHHVTARQVVGRCIDPGEHAAELEPAVEGGVGRSPQQPALAAHLAVLAREEGGGIGKPGRALAAARAGRLAAARRA